MKKGFLHLVLFYSLNLFSQAPNQDTIKNQELDPVVIVGDRAKYISGSGQYINILKIEKLNQPNVNNVLRIVPGVNVRDEEGFGLRPNIGLRGTPVNRSAKITLMEDGILIAPAPYADPAAYYFPTFSRMQGIEVLKGSSQIKYGPYTVGGAINLLSTVIPNTFKGFAQVGLGSLEKQLSSTVCSLFGQINDKASDVYGKLKTDISSGGGLGGLLDAGKKALTPAVATS